MCGDGANDCGALKAAHTGISLSEAESSVASPFTSKTANIHCVLDIIKEGRAALVTSFGIFKYMASYSLCQFISVMILYTIDSNLTDVEFLYIDLFIISIFAFFFGRTKAYSGKLVKEAPLNSLISLTPILSIFLQMLWVSLFQMGAYEYLKAQPWYEPFNSSYSHDKDEVGCVENYTIFTISSFQYIILAIVFSKGKPYRSSIFSNYGLILSAIAATSFSVYLALWPHPFLQEQFELIIPENFDFRLILLGYTLANFVVSALTEILVIDHFVFKKLRFKFHNDKKSKRKYLGIEKDLNLDTKWPTLSSSFRSAASPTTPLPSCTAEIVIEKENRFEKNHVLNSLFQSTNENVKEVNELKVLDSSLYKNDSVLCSVSECNVSVASPSKSLNIDETLANISPITLSPTKSLPLDERSLVNETDLSYICVDIDDVNNLNFEEVLDKEEISNGANSKEISNGIRSAKNLNALQEEQNSIHSLEGINRVNSKEVLNGFESEDINNSPHAISSFNSFGRIRKYSANDNSSASLELNSISMDR